MVYLVALIIFALFVLFAVRAGAKGEADQKKAMRNSEK